jgi:hypothetical protein
LIVKAIFAIGNLSAENVRWPALLLYHEGKMLPVLTEKKGQRDKNE